MLVGYVRVSTIEQNEERQIVELKKNGVEKFFVDKISAKSAQRPKFDEMMNFFIAIPLNMKIKNFLRQMIVTFNVNLALANSRNCYREGDELIVTEFSRLARSTVDLLNIVETLTKKNVKVRSLKEQVDFSTPQGKFMLSATCSMLKRHCA